MEQKRKDLLVTKQKELLAEIISKLNESHPSFYYLSTSEIAHEIVRYIKQPGNLSKTDLEAVHELGARDIQILLSFHTDTET